MCTCTCVKQTIIQHTFVIEMILHVLVPSQVSNIQMTHTVSGRMIHLNFKGYMESAKQYDFYFD